MISSWVVRGRWSQTSSGPKGLFEQERGARLRGLQHVEPLEEAELVAGHEIGLRNQVSGVDGFRAKTQVRDGDGAGLFRVIHEVPLRVVVRVLTNDLDRILIGAHGAIRAEAVEHGSNRLGIFGRESRVIFEAGVGDVVFDANGEVVARFVLEHLVKDGFDHGRREFFRR